MSSWFDYDDDELTEGNMGIDDEIWADTVLRLSPRTFLWTYLHSQDLTQDYIKVTTKDISDIRTKFINCGYPLVLNTFNTSQLINWLDNMSPWIVRDLDHYYYGWVVDMNKLANVDTLTDEEIVFSSFNEQIARDFLTIINLGVDIYKLAGTTKLRFGVCPNWLFREELNMVPKEEIQRRVKTWKHIPTRYQEK